MPRTGMLSFTVSGTPSKAPSAPPLRQRAVLSSAAVARARDVERHDGVDLRIDRVDARQHRLERVARRELRRPRNPRRGRPPTAPTGSYAHDRGDRRGAGRALMLGPAGDEDRRIERDRGDDGADRRARVALVVDVGVRQHGVAPAADRAGRARLGLGEDRDDAFGLVLGRVAVEREARRFSARRARPRHRSRPSARRGRCADRRSRVGELPNSRTSQFFSSPPAEVDATEE